MLDPAGVRRRSLLLREIRAFFRERGYLEVDTPLRAPTVLPERHLEPMASEGWWLQPSPEQCMKRLLAQGCQRLFQLCHCFRRGERGRFHAEEFAMVEWYRCQATYHDAMDECEALLMRLAVAAGEGPAVERDGRRIRLDRRPWPRLSVAEAFARYGSVPLEQALTEDRFEEVLVTEIEPCLGWETPVFLIDYPPSLASLARIRATPGPVAERFELYVASMELANGFTELTDPGEQAERFRQARRQGAHGPMPDRFLAELGRIASPCAGVALGVDRTAMLLWRAEHIDQVQPLAAADLDPGV